MAAARTLLLIALLQLAAACNQTPPIPPEKPLTQVTLEVYADYRCPHCARFSASYTPRILRHFAADIDKGRFAYQHRNLPVLGPKSEVLALHGECARAQGRFDQFHDAIYLHQYRSMQDGNKAFINGPGPGLAAVEAAADLDSSTLAHCVSARATAPDVLADREKARALGIRATPTLVLNGTPMEWDSLHSIITQLEAALERIPP